MFSPIPVFHSVSIQFWQQGTVFSSIISRLWVEGPKNSSDRFSPFIGWLAPRHWGRVYRFPSLVHPDDQSFQG
jgi:hypothetical protein